MYDFIIVGGGVSGLVSAYKLQKKGYKVLVLEKEHQVGGRLGTIEIAGCLSDNGTQFLSKGYPVICELLKELELEDSICEASPVLNVISEHKTFHLNTKNPLSLFTSGLLDFICYVKVLWQILKNIKSFKQISVEKASDLKAWDGETAEHFVETKIGKTALTRIFEPFFSGFNYAQSNELSEAMVMRTLGHFYAQKRLFGLKGGLKTFVMALSSQLEVKSGISVNSIKINSENFEVEVGDTIMTGKRVILATTASITKNLLSTMEVSPPEVLNIAYSSSVHQGFVFKKKTKAVAYGNLILREKNEKFNVLTFESQKGISLCGEDLELINLLSSKEGYLKELAGDDLKAQGVKFIQNQTAYAADELIESKKTIWHEAIPHFPPGRAREIEKYRKTLSSRDRLFLCGDYLGTPCAEGAAESGAFIASLF